MLTASDGYNNFVRMVDDDIIDVMANIRAAIIVAIKNLYFIVVYVSIIFIGYISACNCSGGCLFIITSK